MKESHCFVHCYLKKGPCPYCEKIKRKKFLRDLCDIKYKEIEYNMDNYIERFAYIIKLPKYEKEN